MEWLLAEAPDDGRTPVTLYYDSQYAANMARGVWEPEMNGALIQQVKELVAKVQEKRALEWRWVKGHSDTPGNDAADAAADKGANGQITTQSAQ